MSTITSMLLGCGARALRFGLPQNCLLCSAKSADAPVCAPCRSDLPALENGCPVCALPSPGGEPCGACLHKPPPFERTVAPWRYAYPLDRLVHAFKFQGRIALAPFFAETLEATLGPEAPRRIDIVIPMPLHPQRLRERGYNQASEIARHLRTRYAAGKIPLRIAYRGARRSRRTLAQAALPFSERSRNVRGAFACNMDLKGARVAIVDDVMTTGSTLTELARALKHAGATKVENWVLARTLE